MSARSAVSGLLSRRSPDIPAFVEVQSHTHTDQDRPSQPKGPIFVVGMNGAGTTMVLDRLNSHPQLYGFRIETKILPYYLSHASRFGDLAVDANFRRLLDEMRSAFPFRKVNAGRPIEAPEGWQRLTRTPAAIFDRLMRDLAQREGKHRWCEKSPIHVLHIPQLAEAWPNAQFLHVIRDGRDCAASFHRRWGYTPQASVFRWKNRVRAGRQAGLQLGAQRYLEVRYEALTSRPDLEMERVCRFLGVDYDEAMLTSERTAKRVGGIDSAEIRANDRSFAGYFTPEQCRRMDRIAGAALAELGYQTSDPGGDIDPGPLSRALWTVKDRVNVALRGIAKKVISGRGPSWGLMLRKLQRTVRQPRGARD
jgi:hypothetical protein